MLELFDVSRIQWRFERISRRVSVAEPWTAAHRREPRRPDAGRVAALAARGRVDTRDLMAIMSRVTWGCEPDEVSMLHAVRYVKAAGGIGRMLDVEGGAQQDRFPGGTQQIALRMADELGERVRLQRGRPAHRAATPTARSPSAPTAATSPPRPSSWRSRPLTGRPSTSPRPCPPSTSKLAQHWPQGNLSKAYAAYETPFWRAQRVLAARRCPTRDRCSSRSTSAPATTDPASCSASPTRARSIALPPEQRRERALAGLRRRCSGTRHCSRSTTSTTVGATEDFAPGGPTAAVPPGSWTTYGPWLRKPVDRIFWAGTETADEWTGFLDGAVRSGRRAAAEVHGALSG